jgi:hypothetical protein
MLPIRSVYAQSPQVDPFPCGFPLRFSLAVGISANISATPGLLFACSYHRGPAVARYASRQAETVVRVSDGLPAEVRACAIILKEPVAASGSGLTMLRSVRS